MSDWPDTNPSLILQIKDPQNAAAWNQLMAIYRPVIYRLARRKGLLHEDAEDLVQGVFISSTQCLSGSHMSDIIKARVELGLGDRLQWCGL